MLFFIKPKPAPHPPAPPKPTPGDTRCTVVFAWLPRRVSLSPDLVGWAWLSHVVVEEVCFLDFDIDDGGYWEFLAWRVSRVTPLLQAVSNLPESG